ncbi:nicotinate-nucleotide--dimethylbenzimidazole phosphoribosyltransferase [Nocardiopsis sp. RSe5-2]|uniref:Nicotinate-nucleotide--dimethylbenzimidazole phosphoribosyltransferase n=1 Tax=Nocardiopsis endophytica TaxID=3018445 RepID=A0ABT4UAV4_9ACTN|nr:nicotinate-nucleotide--dimethylbenzimidazole phosphoribosyltransferase [Nocardiopsis endophytica]MDA2814081.1 nicotinate-nucleotide--dimethylbenzimidazole phosphoribosyltransferase [Nocardiopsis endophytica]
MTGNDDRSPAQRGAEDEAAGTGGGLLDDLPEAGRGAAARAPSAPGPAPRRERANPFHTPSPPPRTEQAAKPNVIPFRGAPPAPARPDPEPQAPDPAPQAPAPEPARPAGEPDPAPAPEPEPEPRAAAPEPAAAPPAPACGAPAAEKPDQHEDTTRESTANTDVNAHAYAVPQREPSDGAPRGAERSAAAPGPALAPTADPVPAPEPAAPEPAAPAPEPTAARTAPDENAYTAAERDAVYRVIAERRDVRTGFRPDPVPDEVLTRVLSAAHQAPSVGFSQPWDFVLVQDEDVRTRVQELVQQQRAEYARALPGARARAFSGLKVEAILDTPVNVVVTVDPTRGGRHTLGRHAQPQTASYSTALAVENLWLAARAEGLGVGWVSFFHERDLASMLDLPPHLEVVAYLCLGYVDDFPTEPELALGGWAKRRPLSWAVHREQYGRRGLPGEKATSLLDETIATIGPPDTRAAAEAADRQRRMTKPEGALGVLEEVSVRLSGLAGECPPPMPEPAAVAIFAGDHGVHAQGVTAWPQEVTAQMVHNFLDGGAVANAFAAQAGAEVTVVDVGVVGDLPTVPGLLPRKVARGTADMTQAPAMTRVQAEYAIEAGIEVARDLATAGNRCLLTGDMGIANTTASAALVAAFTGADPAEVTGRGTGIDEAMHERKVKAVKRALDLHRVDPSDPVGVLAAVGGLEHAALAGFILGAAALRVPVLLDGVIAGAASLVATALAPDAAGACFAGHRSAEPGHAAVLEHTGLRPLIDLDLRLGEGSGALLALPLLQASVRALRDVATFEDAGVTER